MLTHSTNSYRRNANFHNIELFGIVEKAKSLSHLPGGLEARLMRLALVLIVMNCSCPAWAVSPKECKTVLSVSELSRQAPQLDGKVVCIRGVLRQASLGGGSKSRVVAPEMISTEQLKAGVKEPDTVGVIDWDAETGFSPDFYRPDSFSPIEQPSERQGRTPANVTLVDITARVGVMYKRHFLEKAREAANHVLGEGSIQGQQRDVEVVLLQVIRVNRRASGPPSH